MRRILYFILLVFLVSCKNSENIELSYFELEDFPRTKYCTSKSISIQVANSLSYHVLHDSLVLVTTRGNGGYFVEMYNLNSKQKIMDFAQKGLNANQFSHARVVLDETNVSSIFYLYNVITNSIVEINIDSLLKYEDSYSFKKIYFSGYTNVPSFCKYDETRYLAQNKYYSIVKDLDNDVDRFLFVKKNEFDITNSTYSKSWEYKYYLSNINKVIMFSDSTKNRLWCVLDGEDRFDIYKRDDLSLLKSYSGPYHYDVEYVVGEAGRGSLPLVVRNGVYSGYSAAVTTDSCVYLLLGNQNYKGKRELPDRVLDKSEIYKLSWEGELLCRYILDSYVYAFSMDSEGKYFYCTVKENRQLDPKFVYYEL